MENGIKYKIVNSHIVKRYHFCIWSKKMYRCPRLYTLHLEIPPLLEALGIYSRYNVYTRTS